MPFRPTNNLLKPSLPLGGCGVVDANAWANPSHHTKSNSITTRIFAHLRHKVTIGYSGAPHIHPQNCPFPWCLTVCLWLLLEHYIVAIFITCSAIKHIDGLALSLASVLGNICLILGWLGRDHSVSFH